jgi:hypothetical protein
MPPRRLGRRLAFKHEEVSMRKIAIWPVLALSALLIAGCASSGSSHVADDEAGKTSGPTLYGKMNVSVDHVSTR